LNLFSASVPASADELRNDLEAAVRNQDTNSFIELYNWEGVTNESKASAALREMLIKHEMFAILRSTNPEVELLPTPSNFPLRRTNLQSGLITTFNVPVLGLLEVKPINGIAHQLPYGRKREGFYLAGIKQETMPGKALYVRVLAGPNSDLLSYTGRWTYLEGTNEKSIAISDKTNLFLDVWGDQINSCEIRRTSTNQVAGFSSWFYFQIDEGGENIFESPELTNEDLFIYRRK
jgi:hypothetical protein